ncbi:hypothetical protein [Natronospora cellulosivora (SeqCode)]
MSFGYSRDIFRYPAVQYIPLSLKNSRIKKTERTSRVISFSIFSYEERRELEKRLKRLNLKEEYHFNEDELVILVNNYEIDIIKYRGHNIIMVGERKPNTYHLFTITRKYFYKNNLAFILYDGSSSERVAIQRFHN